MPFAPAGEAVAYLESLAAAGRQAAAIYFDDIEKFGIWPETHEWVYGKRLAARVRRGACSRRRGSRTPTLRRLSRGASAPRGIVYLPTTSYIEMNEWTLPRQAAPASTPRCVAREKAAGRYDARKAFLRGGIWRNFLSRYPEANWMHKRMLALSARLAALPPRPADTDELRALLHLAQANDAYWHGLFGGLYLPHLRRGVWRHLCSWRRGSTAVRRARALSASTSTTTASTSVLHQRRSCRWPCAMDGRRRWREIDCYRLAQNFGDTLRRHAEHYHARSARDGAGPATAARGIASAHDRVRVQARDRSPPSSCPTPRARDAVPRHAGWTPTAACGGGYRATRRRRGGHHGRMFEALVGAARIGKRIVARRRDRRGAIARARTARAAGLRPRSTSRCRAATASRAAISSAGRSPAASGSRSISSEPSEVVLDDRHMGGSVVLRLDPPARVTARPYHTVSQSEEGFERVMQSVTLDVEWTVAGDAASFAVHLAIRADAG